MSRYGTAPIWNWPAMKWKIVASPTKGQSSERQSSQPAAIASGKLKRVANPALDDRARVQPAGRRPSEPFPSDHCLWLANRSSILQCVDDRVCGPTIPNRLVVAPQREAAREIHPRAAVG